MADSLLDVILCAPTSTGNQGLLTDSRSSLHSLEKVLIDVGGSDSHFLATLRKRMLESQLPVPQTLWNDLQLSNPKFQSADAEVDPLEQT